MRLDRPIAAAAIVVMVAGVGEESEAGSRFGPMVGIDEAIESTVRDLRLGFGT